MYNDFVPDFYIPSREELKSEFTGLYEHCKAEIEKNALTTKPVKQSNCPEDSLPEECYKFKLHLPYLEGREYVKRDGDGFVWMKGGSIVLAAYFGMLQEHNNSMKSCKWAAIERIFKVDSNNDIKQARNLASHYNDFEKVRKCKSSKHDNEIKELENLVQGKIKA
jgi:hypothetical protein